MRVVNVLIYGRPPPIVKVHMYIDVKCAFIFVKITHKINYNTTQIKNLRHLSLSLKDPIVTEKLTTRVNLNDKCHYNIYTHTKIKLKKD